MGGKDVFAKTRAFQLLLNPFKETGYFPYYLPLDSNEGTVAYFQGEKVFMLGSNNYLGLTSHPKVREASIEAIRKYGTSLTGSRFLNGSIKMHEEFEGELAEFVGKEAALVFATGYQTNIGIISAIANAKTVVISDKKNHASIRDGTKISDGREVLFKHNDILDLKLALRGLEEDEGAFVAVDGIFSMEGDIINLSDVVKVTKEYEGRVLVDDAHALGVLGKGGRGTASHFGLTNEVDIMMATFSKSFASIGGFVASDSDVIDYIRIFGRSIIFSASLNPANIASARCCLNILKQEPERVARLKDNGNYLRNGLKNLGFNATDGETPIIPIVVGNDFVCVMVWKALLDAGVYVNPVLYPAVGKNTATLRVSVTATHTFKQLDEVLEIFQKVGGQYGLLNQSQKASKAF
ncbi:MAG: pyridoxal phosphate-dependent aminotransferase family protein [Deltaproteobacteria bacterium]|nr:pyridoxal phosphate-dependent aminotransferase family protein [Deltaproteobacteria bacterium]